MKKYRIHNIYGLTDSVIDMVVQAFGGAIIDNRIIETTPATLFEEENNITVVTLRKTTLEKQLTKAKEEGRREQVSETKSKFVEIAQKGFGDDDNLKGLMLYERFMEYLKSLKVKNEQKTKND